MKSENIDIWLIEGSGKVQHKNENHQIVLIALFMLFAFILVLFAILLIQYSKNRVNLAQSLNAH